MTISAYLNPTAQDAISALVTAEGDLDLAAELLFGRWDPKSEGPPPKARLIAIIAEDPTAQQDLQKQLRTLTLLQTFNTTRLVGVTVEGALDKLPGSDRAKLYTSLLSVLASLTDEHSTSFNANIQSTSLNVSEQIFRQLPPEIRENLKVLMAAPPELPDQRGEVPISSMDGSLNPPTPRWSGGNPLPNAANGTS